MTKSRHSSAETATDKAVQKKRTGRRRLNFTSQDWYEQAFKTFAVSAKREGPDQSQSPPLVPKQKRTS
jgi:hypothetical protein